MKYIITFFFLINCSLGFSTTLNWNLNSIYGVSQSGFSSIILDAKNHFTATPNDTIIININAGTYNIGGNGSDGISISLLSIGINGRLIIKGAGMNNTTLVFTEVGQDMMRISNSNNISITDLHMTRTNYTVTQGIVQSIGTGYIDLEIQYGFPNPLSLYNNTSDQGRYLRRYTNSSIDPQVIQTNNNQIAWGYPGTVNTPPTLISGNIWRFQLNNPNLVASNYSIGELVGVKSKHEGEIYSIIGGSNFLFENVKWTHSTRGLARFGTQNLTIKNCRIERGAPINGQTPCMSSPSGGPQMNQPNDTVSSNMIVDSCYIDSPGDDCVAFFNVNGGKVINSTLRNSFARGILIIPQAQNICISNNTIENNPILGTYSQCVLSVSNQDNIKPKILVYPNPTTDKVHIQFDKNYDKIEYCLYNSIGQLVKTKKITNLSKTEVEIKGEKGLYILEILTDNNISESYKILKN